MSRDPTVFFKNVPKTLEMAYQANTVGTTFERMARHLVFDHGQNIDEVMNKSPGELTGLHHSLHCKGGVNHKHSKNLVNIIGYEMIPAVHQIAGTRLTKHDVLDGVAESILKITYPKMTNFDRLSKAMQTSWVSMALKVEVVLDELVMETANKLARMEIELIKARRQLEIDETVIEPETTKEETNGESTDKGEPEKSKGGPAKISAR